MVLYIKNQSRPALFINLSPSPALRLENKAGPCRLLLVTIFLGIKDKFSKMALIFFIKNLISSFDSFLSKN